MSDDEEHSPSKRPTVSPVTPSIDLADQIEEDKTGSQVECDEQLARMLQESYDSSNSLVEVDNVSTQSADDITDSLSVVKNLAKKVNDSGEFFIVVRRNSPVTRLLSLWSREIKRRPEATHQRVRVRFIGESGIDSGAMAKEQPST